VSVNRISLLEAAGILGVSTKTIRRYIAAGSLPAERIEGSRLLRVKKDDVESLLRPVPTAGQSS
jgi:excisionase family DNA binding protein